MVELWQGVLGVRGAWRHQVVSVIPFLHLQPAASALLALGLELWHELVLELGQALELARELARELGLELGLPSCLDLCARSCVVLGAPRSSTLRPPTFNQSQP